jgi:hypothetical protein
LVDWNSSQLNFTHPLYSSTGKYLNNGGEEKKTWIIEKYTINYYEGGINV